MDPYYIQKLISDRIKTLKVQLKIFSKKLQDNYEFRIGKNISSHKRQKP